MVLGLGVAVKLMILLTSIHDRTSARVPSKNSEPTQSTAKLSGRAVGVPTVFHLRWTSAYLRGRSLLLSPGVCPCFATTPLMYECSLYPVNTAVAFYSQGTTVCAGSGCVLVGEGLVRAPRCTSPSGADGDLANASFCARCAAAERCKPRLWTDWHTVWPLYSQRCSSPFTLRRSHQPHSASHQPLCATAPTCWVLLAQHGEPSRAHWSVLTSPGATEGVPERCMQIHIWWLCVLKIPFSRWRVNASIFIIIQYQFTVNELAAEKNVYRTSPRWKSQQKHPPTRLLFPFFPLHLCSCITQSTALFILPSS